MKRKYIYLFMILSILIFTGCKKKVQMTDFIPTSAPEDITVTQGAVEEDVQTEPSVTPTPEAVVIGQTTPMFVKLDQYGGFLNVRSAPSTEGAPVGFLVHAELIEVIEIVDGWASFLYNDAICYVNADFLVTERPEYLDPPTPTPKPKVTPTPVPKENPPEI